MKRLAYAPIYIGLYCALMIAFTAAIYARSDPGSLLAQSAFWGAIYALTLAYGWRQARAPNPAAAKLTERLALVAGLVFVLMLLGSGWEAAMLYFLVIIQAARNLTLSTRRDLSFAYVVSFVWIAYAAAGSKDAAFLVFVVLYVLAIVFTLMADHIDERIAEAQGGDAVMLARGVSFPINVFTTSAAIVALGFALYMFTPRPSPLGIQAFPAHGGTQYDGDRARERPGAARKPSARTQGDDGKVRIADTGDDVDVMNPGNGNGAGRGGQGGGLANPILFYMQADRGLYLRAQVFDSFDGARWHRTREGVRPLAREGRGFSASEDREGQTVGQVITLNVEMPARIPAAFRATTVYFPAPVVLADTDEALRALRPLDKGLVYSVKSRIAYRDERPYGANEAAPRPGGDLQVPANLSERARQLAREVTAGANDSYARAALLERYLKSHYRYTLATMGQPPAPDLVDHFLFESREGHCEIFATTLATLLRSLDIPARFVTGYAATEYNPITGYYEVRALNGHAWVEAYIAGMGWVTFEATPGYVLPQTQQPRMTLSAVMRYLQQQLDTERLMQPQHTRHDVRADILAAWAALKAAVNQVVAALRAAAEILLDLLARYGAVLVALVLAIIGAVYAARRLRLGVALAGALDRARLRRADREDARGFILLCYAVLERVLARHGLPRLEHWTHRDYQHALARRLNTEAIARLADLFGIARYSGLPLIREQADEAYGCYEAVLSGIRARRES